MFRPRCLSLSLPFIVPFAFCFIFGGLHSEYAHTHTMLASARVGVRCAMPRSWRRFFLLLLLPLPVCCCCSSVWSTTTIMMIDPAGVFLFFFFFSFYHSLTLDTQKYLFETPVVVVLNAFSAHCTHTPNNNNNNKHKTSTKKNIENINIIRWKKNSREHEENMSGGRMAFHVLMCVCVVCVCVCAM